MAEQVSSFILNFILNQLINNRQKLKEWFLPTKYLNYDPLFLCNFYRYETPIVANSLIPYKEEVCWIDSTPGETRAIASSNNISVRKLPQNFRLAQNTMDLKAFQGQAYSEFKASRKIDRDTDVIRLDSLKNTQKGTEITIQKAKYYDQVQSNLVMDWSNDHALKKIGVTTLRAYIECQYSHNLPPLSDKRLANTIGIATIIFYRNSSGAYVPYLPQRAKGLLDKKKILAVYEGGYHCTSSGAAEWSEGDTFDQVFLKDMYRELYEEVGIKKEDIEIMLPVALCREFLRGGKPQIFFAGLTTSSENELVEARRSALQRQKALPEKVEIKDEQLIVSDIDLLMNNVQFYGLTLEAIANLYYADKFIKTVS